MKVEKPKIRRHRFGTEGWAARWKARREAACICGHPKYEHRGHGHVGGCLKRRCKCKRFKFADPALRGCTICKEHSKKGR